MSSGIKGFNISKTFKISFYAVTAAAFGGTLYLIYRQSQRQEYSIPGLILPSNFNQDLQQNRFLTKQMAQVRSSLIRQETLHYLLNLKLSQGNSYEGTITIKFQVQHTQSNLFIDYRGQDIEKVTINGKHLIQFQWNKLFLIIPKKFIKPFVENELEIQFKNKYATDGCGLHSYVDSDGKQYLYSQGESYFNNRFFPCLDQPDLKGTFKLTVQSPKQWILISNEKVLNQIDRGEFDEWNFAETKRISSYLITLVAGPYKRFDYEHKLRDITFSSYCRESLVPHFEKLKDFIFEVTKKSMEFYEQFFQVEYAFSKYDSVFVAEFNFGAMENPGCVNFNDGYIYKEKMPMSKYVYLGLVITHEMAHQWFGNLVTMKWWDDLWLNESYAEFICHYCLENLKIQSIELHSIPVFFNTSKSWGYREDQMITTHPIAGEVPNTEVAENIFDGITYSKGAAVIKQLLVLLTPQLFGEACGSYFKKYSWQNATLDDFINHLEEKFSSLKLGFSLQEWKSEWIQTAGLNEIEPIWSPDNDTLQIKQTAALHQFPTLRRHKIKVAFIKEDLQIDVKDVIVKNEEITKVQFDVSQNYKAVLLNYEDQSFIKILLDQVSLDFFKNHLTKINDILTRTLIWRSLFDAVRDAKICSEEYMDFILAQIPHEPSDEIAETQLNYLAGAITYMTPRRFKKDLSFYIFNFIASELKKLKDQNNENLENRITIFRNKLFQFTQNDLAIDRLLAWQSGYDQDLQGIEISNNNKWSIVCLIHESRKYDDGLRIEALKKQCEADQSDLSKKMIVRCKAYVASAEERKELWNSYLDQNNKESMKMISESMSGFNNSRRFMELQEYQDKFFDVIIDIFKTRSTDFAKTFYEYLFPITDDLATISKVIIKKVNIILQKISDKLNETPDNLVTLKQHLAESQDSIQRKLRQFETFGLRAKISQQK